MKVKIVNISAKSFVVLFTAINVVSGFVLGAVATGAALLNPSAQAPGEINGVWSIIIFPFLNGLLGLVLGFVLIGMYNFFSSKLGGVEMELENL